MKRACIRFLPGCVLVVTGLAMGVPRAISLRAQDHVPERLPSFEVASVKENVSGDSRARAQTLPGGRYVATNVLLKGEIAVAFLGACSVGRSGSVPHATTSSRRRARNFNRPPMVRPRICS